MKQLLTVITAALSLAGTAQAESPNRFPDDIETDLVAVMKTINDKAPVMIDPNTRLEGITREAWNTITYHFSATNHDAAALKANNWDNHSREWVLSKQCESKKAAAMRDMGLISRFAFSGKDGVLMNTIVVDKQVCEKHAG